MLVLSRKENQSVVIGDTVEVKVVAIQGNRVRLAFNAPPEVAVQRQEVRERILAEEAGHSLAESAPSEADAIAADYRI
ncbi:MAG: carbon storage regulator CsrA [Planctomycetales bacterium]|nr:carbon storage regulator CsrA [Planctomycetales bacterium]MCA9162023.1 carbon storage regulator CsrA [Planctomycetales bacterium]MCA9208409.1 carbon storage regulator CsrA [Planctomycetales bacterium]